MKKKRHNPEQIIRKLREAEKLKAEGDGPCAWALFEARTRLPEEERAALRAAPDTAREKLLMTAQQKPGRLGSRAAEEVAIERKSIERAFAAFGELTIRRGRVYMPNQLREGAIY